MHGPTEFSAVEDFGLAGKVVAADLVICISDYCRSQLMALVDESHWDKLVVIHCGVDVTQVEAPAKEVMDGRALRVLCVGRIVAAKGQTVLVDAVAALRRAGVRAEVVLVGAGPMRSRVEQQVRAHDLEDVVRFTGPLGQDDIRRWYEWADVFCLPSFAEGVPVVLMEAMAAGVPVVTTQIAGIPELVEQGRSGILVRPGRADLVAAALADLARDPALRERLSDGGLAAVQAEFDQSKTVQMLRDAFAAIGRRPAPAATDHPGELGGRAMAAAKGVVRVSPVGPFVVQLVASARVERCGGMGLEDVRRALAALEARGVACWLAGGWAVDAVCGRQRRAHQDVDVVLDCYSEQVSEACSALATLGYAVVDERDVPGLWMPQARTLEDGFGHQVQLVSLDRALVSSALGLDPAAVDSAAQMFARGDLGGHGVPCLAPAVQVLLHSGYPARRSDNFDMARLRRRYPAAMQNVAGSDAATRVALDVLRANLDYQEKLRVAKSGPPDQRAGRRGGRESGAAGRTRAAATAIDCIFGARDLRSDR